MKPSAQRRVFINSGINSFQIFSFVQEEDGSIYCTSPGFSDAKWIGCQATPNGAVATTAEAVGDGKISIHGSGVTAIRPHNDLSGHTLRIKGTTLVDLANKQISARHLFTSFLKEPYYDPPGSPLFNRESDYSIQSGETLNPFVLMLFALPQQGLSVHFGIDFQIDELESFPGDVLGMHIIPLRYHDILWFAYKTKNMNSWPKQSHFSYTDGFMVPIFIGTQKNELKLELRAPIYELSGKDLKIQCTRSRHTD